MLHILTQSKLPVLMKLSNGSEKNKGMILHTLSYFEIVYLI